MNKITELTIEPIHRKYPHEDEMDWWFCQHGEYGEESVVAGYEFRQLIKSYPTKEQAVEEHPEANVLEQEWKPPEIHLSHITPSDFHEEDAGERWDDDY